MTGVKEDRERDHAQNIIAAASDWHPASAACSRLHVSSAYLLPDLKSRGHMTSGSIVGMENDLCPQQTAI